MCSDKAETKDLKPNPIILEFYFEQTTGLGEEHFISKSIFRKGYKTLKKKKKKGKNSSTEPKL